METTRREDKNEIIVFHPNESLRIEVRFENETVWLTQAQIAELFGTKRQAISKHLINIFNSNELDRETVCSILEHTASDGKRYKTAFYNLDAILSVGYRVNSKNASLFRQWSNSVLKDYLMRGYSINHRIDILEKRVTATEQKIDFFVHTALPPVEGVFYEGQIFDAFVFVSDLIKRAKTRIILIDNYIDETVLTLLDKRKPCVSAIVYTSSIDSHLKLDIQKHNAQYPPISILSFRQSHDRFLVIDNDFFHIGASLKDLGKKLFAFSKMHEDSLFAILEKLPHTR